MSDPQLKQEFLAALRSVGATSPDNAVKIHPLLKSHLGSYYHSQFSQVMRVGREMTEVGEIKRRLSLWSDGKIKCPLTWAP